LGAPRAQELDDIVRHASPCPESVVHGIVKAGLLIASEGDDDPVARMFFVRGGSISLKQSTVPHNKSAARSGSLTHGVHGS
jgi:hypothetical protein